jgi:serine/threonine protein kinase
VKKKEMKPIEMYQLRREVEALNLCGTHANVMTLYDFFENEEFYYLVTEYIQGGDLFDYLKARNFSLTESRVRDIVAQLLQALGYLQSFGVIHRDIKLENIMMSTQEESAAPRLIDFGLSIVLGPTQTTAEPYGTLGYVAPEVLQKK